MTSCDDCSVSTTISRKRIRSEEGSIVWERQTGYRNLLATYAYKQAKITHDDNSNSSDDDPCTVISQSLSPCVITPDAGHQVNAHDSPAWSKVHDDSLSAKEESFFAFLKSPTAVLEEIPSESSGDVEESTGDAQPEPQSHDQYTDKECLLNFWKSWKGIPENSESDNAFKKLLQGQILPGYNYAHSTHYGPSFPFAVTPLKATFEAAADKNKFAVENSIIGIQEEYRCNLEQCPIRITALSALGHVKTEHPHWFPHPGLTGHFKCCYCSTQTTDTFHFRACPRLKRRQIYTCTACLRITRDSWNARLHWEHDSHFRGARIGARRKDYRATSNGWCAALEQENQWRWPKAAKDSPKPTQDAKENLKDMRKEDKLAATESWILATQSCDE